MPTFVAPLPTEHGPARPFGASGEGLSVLGLGAWAMGGGGWSASWGPQDDSLSVATIEAGIDEGLTWVDTAAVYGLGHSEEVVGEALSGRRSEVFVATKCTRRWRQDGSMFASGEPSSVRQECEDSLRRLRTDYLDLFQLHSPTDDVPVEETWGEMVRLREAGKTRFIGVSNFDVDLLRRCSEVGSVDSVQPVYNILHREIEHELIPWCRTMNIAVLTYGPMAHGTLSGTFSLSRLAPDDWRRRDHPLLDLPAALRAVELLRPLAEARHWTIGQLATAWVVANPDITSALVGARTPAQIRASSDILRAGVDDTVRAEVDRALNVSS
jgi:aryl-alcohol dehydrogenase-like predicted oxidoreductase